MMIATIVSISAFYGLFGPTAKALSAFVALAVAFVTAPLIAWATDGPYYIARKPKRSWQNLESIQCCICEHHSSRRTWPPARPMPGRSARCAVRSTPAATTSASRTRAPAHRCRRRSASCCRSRSMPRINSQFGHYLGVFAVRRPRRPDARADLSADVRDYTGRRFCAVRRALEGVFFALTIIIGVVAWLFVLAQQSRRAARRENAAADRAPDP